MLKVKEQTYLSDLCLEDQFNFHSNSDLFMLHENICNLSLEMHLTLESIVKKVKWHNICLYEN